MRIGRSRTAALLALGVVLAGCTSVVTGRASPAGNGSMSWTATPPSVPPPPGPAEVQAALLQLTDLPPGWSAGAGSELELTTVSDLYECVGTTEAAGDRVGDAASPSYANGHGSTAQSSITSYRTPRFVRLHRGLFTQPRTYDCATEVLLDAIREVPVPPGASMGAPSMEIAVGTEGIEHLTAVLGMTRPVVLASGETDTVSVEYAVISGRTTEAVLRIASSQGPVDRDVRNHAVEAMAKRIADL